MSFTPERTLEKGVRLRTLGFNFLLASIFLTNIFCFDAQVPENTFFPFHWGIGFAIVSILIESARCMQSRLPAYSVPVLNCGEVW